MALLNPFRIGQGMLNQPPYPYGALGADKMPYWDGNQLRIPSFTPKPWEFMAPDSSSPSVPSAAQMEQPTSGILGGMYGYSGGDGGAGNGVGGGTAPSVGPDMSEAGHVNAPDMASTANANAAATQAQAAGIPSLPDFKDNTAPSAPTAAAEGLAAGVPGSEANAPSGGIAGKSSQQAANQAATQASMANTTAAVAAVDKAVQEQGRQALTDAMRSGILGTNNAIGISDAASAAAAAAAEGLGAAGVAGSNQNSPNAVGGLMSPGFMSPQEVAAAQAAVAGQAQGASPGGLGGADGIGGPGAGGMGSPGGIGGGGSGAPGGSSDAGPGSWRKGGFVGDDGDNKLEARRGILHEREFVINPEMAKALQKHAPGILNKMDRAQKKMMRR